MNVVFVSNYLNHHQKTFCEAMQKLCESFWFIETENNSYQGYQSHIDAPYVLHYFDSLETSAVIKQIVNADAVIFGACPNELITKRMAVNKLSFLYSERFFKKGTWRRFIPTTRKKITERLINYKDKNMYVLCASAYLPYDISLLGFPKSKCFKWGYFPEIKEYNDINALIKSKEKNSLLWAGRLLDWKHPEVAIITAKYLRERGVDFTLKIIGDGNEKENLNHLIQKYNLEGSVSILGSKTPSEVREYMENSEIFLFTSDRREGWGAVLNEAMNSACAVIASHSIGSVPFLIRHSENGMMYHNDNSGELYASLKYLFDNDNERIAIQDNAYNTMIKIWNAQTAAERLFDLSKQLINNTKYDSYKEGPCSDVDIIKS